MEGRLLLRDCALCGPDGVIRSGLSIMVEGNRLRGIAPSQQLPTLPGDWEVPCRGRLVSMGLIDCHAHLVGRQLAPLRPCLGAAEGERRQRALEAALNAGEVEALTALAVARSLRAGTTFLVEHLHCPKDIEGALQRQAKAIRALGARAVVAHANNSDDGSAAGLHQVAANAKFAADSRGDELVRPGLGFASVARCDDALLRELARSSQELAVAIHGDIDSSAAARESESFANAALARLRSLGLLDRNCAVATGCREELLALLPVEAPGLLRVIVPPHHCLPWRLEDFRERISAAAVAIGSGDRPLKEAWQWLSSQTDGRELEHVAVETPARFRSEVFGVPAGDIREGALADLVVWEHIPAQEGAIGLARYLVEKGACVSAAWTIVNGRVVVREGQLLGHDYVSLAQEAATSLNQLRRRAGLPSD